MIKKLTELNEEKKALQSDLDIIKDAVQAASKISTNETPSKEENESISELKTNYPAFFDSDSEQEDSKSLLTKVMGVKRYLLKEISVNEKTTNRLIKLNQEKLSSDSLLVESSSKKGESSKRKMDTSVEDTPESKKNRNSQDDILDSLPYNPFDDIGTD